MSLMWPFLSYFNIMTVLWITKISKSISIKKESREKVNSKPFRNKMKDSVKENDGSRRMEKKTYEPTPMEKV